MKIVIIGFGVVGQATKETLKGNNTIEISFVQIDLEYT